MINNYPTLAEGYKIAAFNALNKIFSNGVIKNPPILKESLYYRYIYDSYYKGCGHLTPYYWLPKWTGRMYNELLCILKNSLFFFC